MPPIPARAIRPPTAATLRRYGLSADDWLAICARQGHRCPVCGEPFGARKLAIDHAHVRGFRAHRRRKGRIVRVMPVDERRQHVRGVLHAWCNRFVRRWLTLIRACAIVEYLKAHEARSSK